MKRVNALSFFLGLVVGLATVFGPSFLSNGLFSLPTTQGLFLGWLTSLGVLMFLLKLHNSEIFIQKRKLFVLVLINIFGFCLAFAILIWGIYSAVQNWQTVL